MHGNKPIAWPHLGRVDAPLYLGKEQTNSSVFGYPNTRCGISKHACLEISKLLFAVSIYVYISVHEIYVYRAIREHCQTLWTIFSRLYLRLAGKAPTVLQVFALGEGNL